MKSEAERRAEELLRNIGEAAPPVKEDTWTDIVARVDEVGPAPADVATGRRRLLVSVAAGLLVIAVATSLFAAAQGGSSDGGDRAVSGSERGSGSELPAVGTAGGRVTPINAYPLPQDARSAIIFRLSTAGIRGRVVSVGEPEVARPDADAVTESGIPADDALMSGVVSVPVEIAVDDVYYGTVEPGATVILRILGGDIGELATEAESASALPLLVEGTEIAFFSGDGVSYEDGRIMYTPDQIFVADGDHLASAWGTNDDATTWDEIEALVAERERQGAKSEREGIMLDQATLPSGIQPADEYVTARGFTILTFTPDGAAAMRGDGPYLRITAGHYAAGGTDLQTRLDEGAETIAIQGRDAVVLVDEDTDPRNLDLPGEMKNLKNPWVSVAWLDERGNSIAVQGKGLSVAELAKVAEGTSYQG